MYDQTKHERRQNVFDRHRRTKQNQHQQKAKITNQQLPVTSAEREHRQQQRRRQYTPLENKCCSGPANAVKLSVGDK